jgi:hypothetical protein
MFLRLWGSLIVEIPEIGGAGESGISGMIYRFKDV